MPEDSFEYIVKVYSILVVQLIVTFYLVWILRGNNADFSQFLNSINVFIYFLIVILLIVGFALLPTKGYFYTKLFIFTVFALCKGVLIYVATQELDDNSLEASMISTLLTFGAMTFVGYIIFRLGYDIGWMLQYLVIALIGLIIAHVVMIFRPPDNETKKIVIYFGIMLFSLFVGYDTNVLLVDKHGLYNDDYLSPAMDFYLDFINLFLRFASLENLG